MENKLDMQVINLKTTLSWNELEIIRNSLGLIETLNNIYETHTYVNVEKLKEKIEENATMEIGK